MSIRVEIDLRAVLDRALRVKSGMQRAIQAGLDAAAPKVIAILSKATPVASGRMASAWEATPATAANRLVSELEIVNRAPYSAAVEGGRRAGSNPPPIKAIMAWMEHKGFAMQEWHSRDNAKHNAGRALALKSRSGKGRFKLTIAAGKRSARSVLPPRAAFDSNGGDGDYPSSNDPERIARAIARSIGKRGIQPAEITVSTADVIADVVQAEIKKAVGLVATGRAR